ncbi:hypothetical protein PALU110988_05385 [Paenibacillus lupini]|uniref:hypothetical protein n=1 Tax=Paenibacillus lupini TaxID=1450204 RepID=UPI001422C39D|nr:hypothetical protein [Paenibacillus lupini]NIK25264.1 hypothetical protein [Paenibacillus lupini]
MDDMLRETIENYAKNKLSENQMVDMFQRLNLEESFAVRERYIKHFSKNQQQLIDYRNDQESSVQLWNTFDSPAKLIDVNQMINAFPLSSNLYMFFDYDYRNQSNDTI